MFSYLSQHMAWPLSENTSLDIFKYAEKTKAKAKELFSIYQGAIKQDDILETASLSATSTALVSSAFYAMHDDARVAVIFPVAASFIVFAGTTIGMGLYALSKNSNSNPNPNPNSNPNPNPNSSQNKGAISSTSD